MVQQVKILIFDSMKKLILTAFAFCLALSLWAQSGSVSPFDEPPIGPDPGGPSPSTVPVDGGASLLAFAGAGYAIKKFKNNKEQKA